MPLRKAKLYATGTPADNMASFVNVTSKRLHLMKLVQTARMLATIVALDSMKVSIDEVPVAQANTNDSRSHIMEVDQQIGDATGAGLAPTNAAKAVLSFNRNDLVLDSDEAIFMNGIDVAGAATIEAGLNVWYDD